MDCLMKTVRSEGYFGMYRGETLQTDGGSFDMCATQQLLFLRLQERQST